MMSIKVYLTLLSLNYAPMISTVMNVIYLKALYMIITPRHMGSTGAVLFWMSLLNV